MVGPVEVDHFEGEDLRVKVRRALEGDGQVDLPEGYRSVPGDDAVEGTPVGRTLKRSMPMASRVSA